MDEFRRQQQIEEARTNFARSQENLNYFNTNVFKETLAGVSGKEYSTLSKRERASLENQVGDFERMIADVNQQATTGGLTPLNASNFSNYNSLLSYMGRGTQTAAPTPAAPREDGTQKEQTQEGARNITAEEYQMKPGETGEQYNARIQQLRSRTDIVDRGTGQATTGVPTVPISSYTGPYIVDYLNSLGQPSDRASRAILAQKMGIQNYAGTAEQNTQLLNALRGGQMQANPLVNTSSTPPVSTMNQATQPSSLVNTQTLQQYGLSTPNPNQSPMLSFTETYKELLESIGVPEIKKEFDKIQKEYDNLQNELNDKVQEINDNPWLSEGIRVKQVRSLQERYEGKSSILTNKLNLYNSLYEQGIDEAKFIAQETYNQYQFETSTQLKLYELGQKQLEAERGEQQQAFENQLANRKLAQDQEQFYAALNAKDTDGSDELNDLLSVDEATKLGVPYGTTKGDAAGLQSNKGASATNFKNLLQEYSKFLGSYSAVRVASDPTLNATKNSLVSQLTAEYKQMKQLGTLDAGVQKLIDGLLGQGGISSFSNLAQKVAVDSLLKSFSPESGGDVSSYLKGLGY